MLLLGRSSVGSKAPTYNDIVATQRVLSIAISDILGDTGAFEQFKEKDVQVAYYIFCGPNMMTNFIFVGLAWQVLVECAFYPQ